MRTLNSGQRQEMTATDRTSVPKPDYDTGTSVTGLLADEGESLDNPLGGRGSLGEVPPRMGRLRGEVTL
jgi:hypothetical protein